jgi:hypothetical protein
MIAKIEFLLHYSASLPNMIHFQQVWWPIAGLGAELLFENGWWPNIFEMAGGQIYFKQLVAEHFS